MNSCEASIERLIEKFEEQLGQFIRERNLPQKGLLLGEIHSTNFEIQEIVKEQTSIVSKRRIQAVVTPLNEKFTRLEKEFLSITQLYHYEAKFNDILDAHVIPLEFLSSDSQLSLSASASSEIYQFRNSKSAQEGLVKLNEKLDSLKKNSQLLMEINLTGLEEETVCRHRAVATKYRQEILKTKRQIQEGTLQSNLMESDIHSIINSNEEEKKRKEKGFNYSNPRSQFEVDNHEEEDQFEQQNNLLQQHSTQHQRELALESFNIDNDEEIEREKNAEIMGLASDLRHVNCTLNQIQVMLLDQGREIEAIDSLAEETRVEAEKAEAEINQAVVVQNQGKSKLFKLKGALLGAGVGFLAGGPIGTLVGGIAGVSVGKVVSLIL